MKTGNHIQTTKTTVRLSGRLYLKIGIIVAAVAGCLLAAPLTRAHNHMNCEQGVAPYVAQSAPSGER